MALLERLNRPVFALVAVAFIAGGVRFYHLSNPPQRVFDEAYYPKDACLYAGYSWKQCDIDSKDEKYWVRERDEVGSWVHPPLGKWMIAVGEMAFGPTPFGWRVSAAVAGTTSVVLSAYLALLLFRSTVWTFVAGLLLATESLHFVQSRVGLLDIFLTFWVVLAFVFLVLDRRWIEKRTPAAPEVDEAAEESPVDPPSPLWRPWRFAAGAAFGAAFATKWSGALALLAGAILAFAWERTRRRKAGTRHPILRTIQQEALGFVLAFLLVPIALYLVSYARYWMLNGIHPVAFWKLQAAMESFHVTLNRFKEGGELTHPYESAPWGWPLLLRPVKFYFKQPGSQILDVGNPAVFWASLVTVPYMAIAWWWKRDWRCGLVLVAALAQWLPWFLVADRVQFLFYMTPITPFLVLAATYSLKDLSEVRLRGSTAHAFRPVATAYVIVSVLAFAYFWPLLTAVQLSPTGMQSRIWLRGWT